jgi:hypothetical protein
MKLLMNEKYVEVGFWSFLKCSLLVQLAMLGLFYGAVLVLTVVFVMLGVFTGV